MTDRKQKKFWEYKIKMDNFFLNDLINWTNGKAVNFSDNKKINNISIDTRTIKENDAFFAICGKNLDGHNFIQEAINKKASVIVYSKNDVDTSNKSVCFVKVKDTALALEQTAKNYKANFKKLFTVAITGSNGKTTTKELIAAIFKQKAETLNNQGNFNNRIGVPLTIFNLTRQHKYAVIEMGTSEFGEIGILSNIVCPDCAVLTNIGDSHLEFFKNRENVLKEKIHIIDNLSKDGFVVLNNDDIYFQKILPSIKNETITYGFGKTANVRAENINLTDEKPSFHLYINNKFITRISVAMKGKFNILNSLAAIAVAYKLNFSIDCIKTALLNFNPPKMRMQTTKIKNEMLAINDAYNANPCSMQNSILSLKDSYPKRKVILVLGDMLELGENSDNFHKELGKMIDGLDYIKAVFLFGKKVIFTKQEIKNKKVILFEENTSENQEKLFKETEQIFEKNMIVFFKASRSIKLDKIYDGFITKYK